MDKDFMLNYYDKMVRPIWTELMKTPRYQRVACERDKIEREFRRLLDEKLGRKYLELDDGVRCAMLNFFIGVAFFEAGAFFGFFVAALLNAAHAGQEISIKFEEDDNGTEREHLVGAENCTGTASAAGRD